MFDKPYRLKGIHSKKARELVAIFDRESKAQFFKAAKDVYAFAPLVGFLYKGSAVQTVLILRLSNAESGASMRRRGSIKPSGISVRFQKMKPDSMSMCAAALMCFTKS